MQNNEITGIEGVDYFEIGVYGIATESRYPMKKFKVGDIVAWTFDAGADAITTYGTIVSKGHRGYHIKWFHNAKLKRTLQGDLWCDDDLHMISSRSL